jgi:glycosyltransferase involved in cell wall biosynthesis
MTDISPKISVVMPVYNTAMYLNEAIDSILNQTFTDFEFIIIDDCSTDGSLDIIKSYKDERIILIQNEVNKGYVFGLNYAISIAKGKYIARMDSDDISHKNRFESQVNFLTENKDVILCGTNYELINANSSNNISYTHENIKSNMLLFNQFAHPSVMFQIDFLRSNSLMYNEDFVPAEDYDLWFRIIELGGQVTNLSEKLLSYRIHNSQISESLFDVQKQKGNEVKKNILRKLIEKEEIELIFDDQINEQNAKLFYRKRIEILSKINMKNKEQKYFLDETIEKFVSSFEVHFRIITLGFHGKKKYQSICYLLLNEPGLFIKLGIFRLMKFWLKSSFNWTL